MTNAWSGRAGRRPTWAVVAFSLVTVTMLACGNSPTDDSAAPGPLATPTSTGPSLTGTSVPPASSTAPPGPPATRGPKTISFGPITFHTPAEWDIYVREPATTAYIGVLAGGPGDVEIRVMSDYTGTVDALQPTHCLESAEAPISVELVDSGFAPVGGLTADYRLWRFTCPREKTEEHRVWLLPVSHIAIVEQNHKPAVVDVVTTAEVA